MILKILSYHFDFSQLTYRRLSVDRFMDNLTIDNNFIDQISPLFIPILSDYQSIFHIQVNVMIVTMIPITTNSMANMKKTIGMKKYSRVSLTIAATVSPSGEVEYVCPTSGPLCDFDHTSYLKK